jgi:hypothetical protein
MNFTKKFTGNSFCLIAFILFGICLFPGCATKIKVNMLQPAQYHEASLTKAVAVLPFSGPEGKAFAAEIEGVLAGIGIDDQRYFTLVDRAALDKTVSEMQLSQSGMVDQKTAARIGKLVGAQGIYTGVVTQNNYDDSRYYEKRSTCVKYETKRDKDGNTNRGDCISWRYFNVSCTRIISQWK